MPYRCTNDWPCVIGAKLANGHCGAREPEKWGCAESPLNQNDLLAAEADGANVRAVQVRYRLPLIEKNPYQPGTALHDAYHRGYELEAMIGG